jgi:GNAT superfamily N-acetyltransferase
MENPISIRAVVPEDLQELMRMAKGFHVATAIKRVELYEDNVPSWLAIFQAVFSKPDIFVGLVTPHPEVENKLNGFLIATVAPMFFTQHSAPFIFEQALWVDEGFRRQGYSKALIERFCEEGRKRGCSRAIISANRGFKGWKKLGNLYRNMGFEIEERKYLKKL